MTSKQLKEFYQKNQTTIHLTTGLLLCILTMLPIVSHNFIFSQDDFSFHRMRLESYFTAVQNGQFFPKVFPDMANGYGYAADLFYPSVLLLPYAILRFLGLNFIQSYYGYQLIISMTTFLVAYFATKKLTKNADIAYLFSLIYTMATYRLLDQFIRAALGETLAFIFLPLILLGMYQIFYTEKPHWVTLSVSMALLFYAHFITTYLVFITIVLFTVYAILTKRVTQERLLALCKAGILSIALTLFTLIPIFEQTRHIAFHFNENPRLWGSALQVNLNDLVTTSLANSSTNWQDLQPNIGTLLLLFIIVNFAFWRKNTQKEKAIFIAGVAFFVLSSNIFPWVLLRESFLGVIQFPWRMLTLATFFLSLSLAYFISKKTNIHQKFTIPTVVILVLSLAYTSNLMFNFEAKNVGKITNETYETYFVSALGGGREYLPVGTNYDEIKDNDNKNIQHSKNVESKIIANSFNQTRYHVNVKKDNETLTFPKIAYVGYKIEVDGQSYPVNYHNGLLTTTIDQGEAFITVKYIGTFWQKASLMISLTSWLGVIGYGIIRKRN